MDLTFLESPDYRRVRAALDGYRRSRDELTALGVIRSERTVQSDYGEWLAAHLLSLTLAESGVGAGYDATDPEGRTYQIKTRLVDRTDAATSFDFRDLDHPFDFLLGVLLTRAGELVAVVRIPLAEVAARARWNRRSCRLRWTKASFEASWVQVLYRAPAA